MTSRKADTEDELNSPGPLDYLRVLPQYVYPKHLASALMYRLTRIRFRPWKNWQIRWFIRRYGVDMSLAEQPDPAAFPDFNTFFTRALKPGARPLSGGGGHISCPADGTLYDFGDIRHGALLQAKAHRFSVADLLGRPPHECVEFTGGSYVTVYLAPMDYHRVHMPVSGCLREMTYLPGSLYSVNPVTARGVPRLFARNERVVCWFETDFGAMAVVLVGAVLVGGIETVWHGTVTPARRRRPARWNYADDQATLRQLERGAEMGRFNMGSTVVVLLERGALEWVPGLALGNRVKMGETLASFARGGI